MAIYYKFKSARDYDTISIDGPFISVGFLKEKIFETKHLGSGKDLDIVVSNAQTNEEYLDEAMLIPKNTSVLIRRVPGRPRIRNITTQDLRIEEVENVQAVMSDVIVADPSSLKYAEDEWDEFGTDLYFIPDAPTLHSSNPSHPAPVDEKVDEESKIKALIDTPALDWQRQSADGFVPGRGYGRGAAGRMGGRGFGIERKEPPPGYVCHRCNVPGHFIQHCPTNGDPNYDVKRVKPPTGIPKSMLMATPDGSYSLPSGAIAVLKPNEDAFEKEMEGLPSATRSVGELPPELKCPLCKQVMRDAALTSKCCFQSFCDKCIRDHIIAKSMCVCGATDVLADDLLPNKTLRDTINRILECANGSTENVGSMCLLQDTESARCPLPKVLSPTTSAASGGEKKPVSINKIEASTLKPSIEIAEITSAPLESAEIIKVEKPIDSSDNSRGSLTVKEAVVSQVNPQALMEETPQHVASEGQGKKKKKKPRMPGTDMQWNPMPNLAGPDYMMPIGPGPCNPYFNGVQSGFNGFHHVFNGLTGHFPGVMPPFIGYGLGPMDMALGGGVMHPDSFVTQGFGFPDIQQPHRDVAGQGNGMNFQRPIMSREEFEARKAEMIRKREKERQKEGGNAIRDGENSIMNNSAASSSPMKPKSRHSQRQASPPPIPDHQRRSRSERSSRKSDRDRQHHREMSLHKDLHHRGGDQQDDDRSRERHHHHRRRSEYPSAEHAAAIKSEVDYNYKSGVFARISFSGEESSNKHRKTESAAVSSGRYHSRKKSEAAGNESSDEERHFKRRASRYERSPSLGVDHVRHSKKRSRA